MSSASQPQAQILVLTEQIEALQPIRRAFDNLQRYFHKLTHDFETVLYQHNQFDAQNKEKHLQLCSLNSQLLQDFQQKQEQLRELEAKRAKAILEHKNFLASNEAFKSKAALQLKERSEREERKKELKDQASRQAYSIQQYSQLNSQIQFSIRERENQNMGLNEQIERITRSNQKMVQSSSNYAKRIEEIQQKNWQIVFNNKELDSKIEHYNQLTYLKQKASKEGIELCIQKNEEIQNMRHRHQYAQHMFDSENELNAKLNLSSAQLSSRLASKKQQLEVIQAENQRISAQIASENEATIKNRLQKEKMKEHLTNLMKVNETLYSQLERSCQQDRHVYQTLSAKVSRLVTIGDQLDHQSILRSYELNSESPSDLKGKANVGLTGTNFAKSMSKSTSSDWLKLKDSRKQN